MKIAIEMARTVGATAYTNRHYPDRPTHTFNVDQLERFAELVRADERARMAEQPAQQEPVAWMTKTGSVWKTKADETDIPLYTSPPAQRKPLTDGEIKDALADMSALQMPFNKLIPAIARAIEAAHGIKGGA